MKNDIVLKPSYWASVSGGKDSLFMLLLLLKNPQLYRLDGVVHFELEIDFPFIKNVVDYMEFECKKIGVPFVRIKPSVSWFDLYDKYLFPTKKARWCNDKYKLDAKKQLKNYLLSKGKNLICYIGYCFDELSRYSNRSSNEIYPLVDFKILESDVLKWARNMPIFNDYYKFNNRCGCMYCPMMSLTNMAYLLKYYPDNYNCLIKLCKYTEFVREKELGRPFSVFSANPKYNTDYRDFIVRSKYLPILNYNIDNYSEQLDIYDFIIKKDSN